ncbi:MAG: Clp protease ClpP [Roseburia sp.]|nr:Clp protease ClpP [Roseburia sp.]
MKAFARGGRRPSVSINKPVYAMATSDGQTAEITMYGDIYEAHPVDWWTGEPVPGQFILLSEFLEDLKQIAHCKDITIRMNSYGGDAVVAITIHNRLRELAQAGAKLTCIVDGVAMSGGSLIMCACDTVRVNPSSLIMIHKCWASLWGGYNADELRELASTYDAYDKAQVSIYKRKAGLSDTIISHMMGDTTYMTGSEAVEKGFADELIEDVEPISIAASADGRSLFVNGRTYHMAPGMFAPDTIPTVTPEASAAVETNNPPAQTGKEGGSTMTLEEFRAQNPEMAAQLEAEARAAVEASGAPATPPSTAATNPTPAPAVSGEEGDPIQAERQRIQEIDAMAHLFPADMVNAAKYGPNACTAQELAYRVAQSAAKTGGQFMAALEADALESGAGKVGAAATTPDAGSNTNKTPEQKKAEAKASVKALLGKKEG